MPSSWVPGRTPSALLRFGGGLELRPGSGYRRSTSAPSRSRPTPPRRSSTPTTRSTPASHSRKSAAVGARPYGLQGVGALSMVVAVQGAEDLIGSARVIKEGQRHQVDQAGYTLQLVFHVVVPIASTQATPAHYLQARRFDGAATEARHDTIHER